MIRFFSARTSVNDAYCKSLCCFMVYFFGVCLLISIHLQNNSDASGARLTGDPPLPTLKYTLFSEYVPMQNAEMNP